MPLARKDRPLFRCAPRLTMARYAVYTLLHSLHFPNCPHVRFFPQTGEKRERETPMLSLLTRLPLVAIWRDEFAGYRATTFRRDLLAGLTVGAVGLPLALAVGSVMTVLEAFRHAREYHGIIISMRGVPLVDAMGVQAFRQIVEEQHARGGDICFTALQPSVAAMFKRTGLSETIGTDNIYWNSAQAIIALHEHRAIHACSHCHASGESCEALRAARDEASHAALIPADG